MDVCELSRFVSLDVGFVILIKLKWADLELVVNKGKGYYYFSNRDLTVIFPMDNPFINSSWQPMISGVSRRAYLK